MLERCDAWQLHVRHLAQCLYMGCIEHQKGKEKLNSCSANGMFGAVNDGP